MSGKNVLNFAPTGEKKRRKTPVLASVIVIACLVLFAASAFAILAMNDFDIGKALGAREPDEIIDEAESVAADEAATDEFFSQDAVNFLFLCSDSRELTFCQIISVDAASATVRIKPIPHDYTLDTASGEMSLGAMITKMSYGDICKAFSSRNIEISRYVHVTEDNFRRLMSNLGQVPVEINGYYEFNIDAVRYTFSPGVQNMTSDTLLKYMKFAGAGEENLRIQGHAVAAVFRQHFNDTNFQKGESFFSKLINFVDSNITAFDYDAAKSVIAYMTSSEISVAVVS